MIIITLQSLLRFWRIYSLLLFKQLLLFKKTFNLLTSIYAHIVKATRLRSSFLARILRIVKNILAVKTLWLPPGQSLLNRLRETTTKRSIYCHS